MGIYSSTPAGATLQLSPEAEIIELATSTTDFIRRAIAADSEAAIAWGRIHFGVTDELLFAFLPQIATRALCAPEGKMMERFTQLVSTASPAQAAHIRRAYNAIVADVDTPASASWLAAQKWVVTEIEGKSSLGRNALVAIIQFAPPDAIVALAQQLNVTSSCMMTAVMIKYALPECWNAVYAAVPAFINMTTVFAAASIGNRTALRFLVAIEGNAKLMRRAPEHTPEGESLLKLACVFLDVDDVKAIIERFGYTADHFVGITLADLRAIKGVESCGVFDFLTAAGLLATPVRPAPAPGIIAALAVPTVEPAVEPVADPKAEPKAETKEP